MTALMPYIVLAIFFGRAVALKGSVDGIKHMFKPEVISHVSIIWFRGKGFYPMKLKDRRLARSKGNSHRKIV